MSDEPSIEERLAKLEGENAELRAALEAARRENAELKWRLGLDSRTSSKPPSSDPPWKERQSKPSKKGKGKNKGRRGRFRERVEPTRTHGLFPSHCRRCGAPLDEQAVVGNPQVHQVTEIGGDGHEVDEYRRYQLQCGQCGKKTRAELPRGVSSSAFGPRLKATAVTLIVAYRLSRRQTLQALKDFWEVTMSLGALHRCEQQLSGAVARSVARVRKELRDSPVLYMDETGWRQGAKRPWMWVQSTRQLSSFWVAPGRDKDTALRLLGDFDGILCSDDYSAYKGVPLERRQMCWAHRIRDLLALSEYPHEAAYARAGQVLLRITRHLFWALNRVRDGTLSRDRFVRRAKRLRRRFEHVCRWAARHQHEHLSKRKYRGLERNAAALWRFVDHPEVEPTNNCAERALRHAVIWRRISYGHRSRTGRLFVERMLTVVQTLRNQGRNVLQWLTAAASPTIRTATLLPSS